MAEYDIAVIGGDKRTAYMVPFFRESGYKVICFGIQETEDGEREIKHSMEAKRSMEADGYAASLREAVDAADVIVGGIPLEKKGVLDIRELSRLIRKRHTIFGGVIPETFRQECGERNIVCCDFMQVESIAVFNAVATAEGAILEALRHVVPSIVLFLADGLQAVFEGAELLHQVRDFFASFVVHVWCFLSFKKFLSVVI